MFGSMMRDFDDDPFFSAHREQMRRMEQMMGGFMSPFGDLGFPRLMAPDASLFPQNNRRDQRRQAGGGGAMMPFGFGHDIFPNMFSGFERLANDPNAHSYSSSSVFTYSTADDGAPKVYQATSSTRSAPGGIKETRRTVSDSEAGMKKMAIGRHLGEKAHIVERAQYGKETPQQEETQEFLNMEEEEADQFNREWMNKTRRQPPNFNAIQSENNLRRQFINDEQKALPAPSRKRENTENRSSEKNRKKLTDKSKNKAKQQKNDD